jgi:hypothetical protein
MGIGKICPEYQMVKMIYVKTLKDSSSSQNDKNLIWDDTYFETLIESNFRFDLTE